MLVVVAEHRIVDRKDRAARVTEHDIDAFVEKNLHDDIGAGERRAGEWMRFRFQLCVHRRVSFLFLLPLREKVPEADEGSLSCPHKLAALTLTLSRSRERGYV